MSLSLIRILLIVVLLAPVLSGCIAMEPKELNWTSRPEMSAKKAVLKCAHNLSIHSLDGNTERSFDPWGGLYFQACNIAIDPGPHALFVKYQGGNYSSDRILVDFNAKPGRQYQLKYELDTIRTGIISSITHIRVYVEMVKE